MELRFQFTVAVCLSILMAAATSGAPDRTQPIVGRGPSLRIVPSLPDPDHTPLAWRVLVAVRTGGLKSGTVTPQVQADGARVVSLRPASCQVAEGQTVFFFVLLEAAQASPSASMTVTLKEAPQCTGRARLTAGIDLSQLRWERWYQGKEFKAGDIEAPPPVTAKWEPIRLPRMWEDLGITWVRTRFVMPASWRGSKFQVRIRAVDDNDVTFLNGAEIGRTNGWDVQRVYAIRPDLVRWDQENELAIAVDNGFAGGGVHRAPLLIIPEGAEGWTLPFPDPVEQTENERMRVLAARGTGSPSSVPGVTCPLATAAPSREGMPPSVVVPPSVGPRLPLRRMVVRDGILRYEDDGEVALWGVNTYPQSWTQYNTLKKLGVDHKRSVDEDFDDFVQAGIDIIRIHVFDTEITDGQGNLVRNEHLDVLDYLVAQCNRRGIYLMLTPIAWWGSPNGRPDSLSRNTPKEAMSMWPARWPAQANYLRQFLTHKNPYTGHRLTDEPCLVLFEVINEPVYWTCGDVMSASPGNTGVDAEPSRRAMDGVRKAWTDFLPGPEWQSPAAFACFRYETVRRYIDTMIEAMRSTGARQPIAYSAFYYQDTEVVQAIADSRCDAITLSAYPGGLSDITDDKNLLGEMNNSGLDGRFASKARVVYEFDAPGTIRRVSMYPAMARRWRNVGVQVACQFQYDARSAAHLNLDWGIHYLNLWHTPEKMVSFMIGGEVFRRLPRGATFETPPSDQVFPPGAVSFDRNAALLCADDCYMQARPTDWRPLPLPESPSRIVTLGSCPYFFYDGTGLVSVRIDKDVAMISIFSDVERLREGLTGSDDRPLTRLIEREHPFHLRLRGWEKAKVERMEKDAFQPVAGTAGCFIARPGVYRAVK